MSSEDPDRDGASDWLDGGDDSVDGGDESPDGDGDGDSLDGDAMAEVDSIADVGAGSDAEAEVDTDSNTEVDAAPGEAKAGTDTDSREAAADRDTDAPTARVRDALAEVRREVRKAAAVSALVDAALVALAANLVLSLVAPAPLDVQLGLPGVVYAALRSLPLVGAVAPRAVQAASLVAVALGIAAFAGEYLVRLRRPLVEQFEAGNPAVREALRTARDAVEGGSETEMARRLYDDVIARLESTSTEELVATRRVAVTALLVALVSLASVQLAVVDPDLGGLFGPDDGSGVDRPDDDGLQDGDRILGDSEDVQAGDDLENISVTGSGDPVGDGATAPGDGGYGGGGGSGEFESQQAGFAGAERIEDAELVREYNLRIRELDDEEADT